MEYIGKAKNVNWRETRPENRISDSNGNPVVAVYLRVVLESMGSRHLVRQFSPSEWNDFVCLNHLGVEYLVNCD